jgi:hypothetical protein
MGRPQRAQARNQRKQKEFARQESAGGAKKNGRFVEEREENRNNTGTKEDGSSEDLGADFWDVDVIPASKTKEEEEEEEGFDLSSWTNMVEEKFKQSEETTSDSFSQQHCKSSHLKNLFVPQVRKMVQRSGPSQTCSVSSSSFTTSSPKLFPFHFDSLSFGLPSSIDSVRVVLETPMVPSKKLERR